MSATSPSSGRCRLGRSMINVTLEEAGNLLTEAEARSHGRPVVEADLQHHLVEIDVAGVLDRLHHVHGSVNMQVMEDLVSEPEGSIAVNAPGRRDNAVLQRGKGQERFEG